MTLLELGKTPISESNPTGEDVRLGPDFEALSGEIEKMSSPSGAGSLDWNKVVTLASGILTHQSKDILVVCYLCVGLLEVEGLNGLAKGVSVLRDVLENFWADLFPSIKRIKGRQNAIEWWMEKVRSSIVGRETELWPKDKRDKFLEDLKAIDAFLGQHLDDALVMTPLVTNVAALIEAEAIEGEKTAAQQQTPVQEPSRSVDKTSDSQIAPPTSAADTGRPKEVSPEMDADKLLRQGLDILSSVASIIARQDPMNALYFRLNRVIAWTSVTSLPPSTDGKTLIPPPAEQVIVALIDLYRSENWKDLLQAAESRVPEFLFWIDLSRYSAESLQNLGYRDIGEAIATETFLYVKRLSGIERFSFSDGTPFANGETREWLKSIGGQEQRQRDISLSQDMNDLNNSIARETAEALELVKANKLPEALNAFRGKLSQAPSARERFMWQIGFCRLLNRAKQTKISGPYLRELLDHIDIYKIEQWEPALAVEALTIILSGIRLQQGEKDEGLVKNVFDRITALNPARAIDLL